MLIHGDCLEVEWPQVDAIITDPPYMKYKTSRYDASEWHRPIEFVSIDDYAKKMFDALPDKSFIVLFCRWAIHGKINRIK